MNPISRYSRCRPPAPGAEAAGDVRVAERRVVHEELLGGGAAVRVPVAHRDVPQRDRSDPVLTSLSCGFTWLSLTAVPSRAYWALISCAAGAPRSVRTLAGVADSVPVGVLLIGVRDVGTVVEHVRDPVLVAVALRA